VAQLEVLQQFRKLVVGFSGGLDSTVLLHALTQIPALQSKIHALHIHHGLSSHADDWQQHCILFCNAHAISISTVAVSISSYRNIEEQARHARFEVFKEFVTEQDCLLLAHHQHDQAETMILNLARGAGLDGVSGMSYQMGSFGKGSILKPLIHCSKEALICYANDNGLPWVEDESNDNLELSRNYVRHAVLPALKNKWPNIIQSMGQCAVHLQEAANNLVDLAYIDCPELALRPRQLNVEPFIQLPDARINNILRTWLSQHNIQMPSTKTFERLLREVIHARPDGEPSLCWSDIDIRRYQQTLYLVTQSNAETAEPLHWANFPCELKLNENESLTARPSSQGIYVPPGSDIDIRFRVGGECIQLHNKTKSLKKLFQEWGVPPWLRSSVPLIYVNQELVSVLDFCVRDPYYEQGPFIYTIIRRKRHDAV